MMVVGDDFYVRSSPRWICYSFLIALLPTGRPHSRNDEEDIGRVLKRTEAKTRAAKRSPDSETLRVDRTHIQGLFLLPSTTFL